MVGFCICGSFCNHSRILSVLEEFVKRGVDILPILSENSANISTRFGKSDEFVNKVSTICKRAPLTTIEEAEYLSSTLGVECLIVAPCTGNTLSKSANGITDTSVTMAIKAHLRNKKPVVIGLATNDGLSGSFEAITKMYNKKYVFFVPLGQDDPIKKETSLVCDFSKTYETYEYALKGKQPQPFLI